MTAHYGLSLSQEWHTPPVYIAAVRAALGGIDLDPASNTSANRAVQAGQFFDLAADGLQRPWPGRVYLKQTPERFAAAFAHLGTVVRRW